MFSNIFLNRKNLIDNVEYLQAKSGKNLCVMVKANGYGHGAKEIVSVLDGKVQAFGVSNQSEAVELRKITNSKLIVFGACEDYELCIKKKISFALFSYNHAKKMVKLYKKTKIVPRMHLCINSGMNRYGVREKEEFIKIIDLLNKNNLILEGLYTHFSSLSTDNEYTKRQEGIFKEFKQLLPSEKTIVHVGGGMTIFKDIDGDMYRVGLEVYGYGNQFVKPVLSVQSTIVDIQDVKKGEHIGYLCGYTAPKDMKVATIPLGYGDGLPRKMSNKLKVKIKKQEAINVGNICMDAFMVDVTDIKCKIGDKVNIVENVKTWAEMIESTEYEALTNLSKFRGERIIK